MARKSWCRSFLRGHDMVGRESGFMDLLESLRSGGQNVQMYYKRGWLN